MTIASDYERASRTEQEAYDDERRMIERTRHAMALARDILDDDGSALSRLEFDALTGHRDEYADDAWSYYLTITNRTDERDTQEECRDFETTIADHAHSHDVRSKADP